MGLCIHEGCAGGVWRYITISCVASLMHGGIKKNRKKKHCGGINQDGGIEGRALTPSCESTRITTGCWTIIDRKTLDFTKEGTPRPRTEEKPQ